MTWKFRAANKVAVLLAAIVVIGFDMTPASAQSRRQYDDRGRVYYGPNGPNVSYQQGPRTRVYVSKRSWLDAGTEVLPGDRKFTDYAFPASGNGGIGINAVTNTGGKVGWDRSPMMQPFQLPGYNPW